MKIIHVIGYYPPHPGGMELRTKELSEIFAKRGYKIEVFTSGIGANKVKSIESSNLKVHYLNGFEFGHTPFIPSIFFRLITLPNDSVVHLHIAQAFIPEITFLVCKLKGLPFLAHIHLDVEPTGPLGILLPLYKKLICYPIVRRAEAVTVLTTDYKELMNKKYKIPREKIHIIPNGTYFTPGKKKTNTGKPVKILFAGRLSPQKNIPLLLKAISICTYEFDMELELIITGSGDSKAELSKLTKELKIDKITIFKGHVHAKAMQKIYRESDIFVLPSQSESFGSVVVESMASGTPVVATNIPAVRNIIRNGYDGLLVEDDPIQLAKAIQKLSEDRSLYDKLLQNGLKTVKKYDWKNVADKYETLYRKLAAITKR